MRFILFTFILFSIVACKSKIEVAATPKQIEALLKENAVKPPVFKDSIISNYTKEYHNFLKEYLLAIKENKGRKVKQLQKQSQELVEKAKIVSSKLETQAQKEKFQKWMDTQQEKIQLLNNIK